MINQLVLGTLRGDANYVTYNMYNYKKECVFYLAVSITIPEYRVDTLPQYRKRPLLGFINSEMDDGSVPVSVDIASCEDQKTNLDY